MGHSTSQQSRGRVQYKGVKRTRIHLVSLLISTLRGRIQRLTERPVKRRRVLGTVAKDEDVRETLAVERAANRANPPVCVFLLRRKAWHGVGGGSGSGGGGEVSWDEVR